MKKGTHIQTEFIRFLIEKHNSGPKLLRDEEIKKEKPELEDEEIQNDETDEPQDEDDDEVIEKLLNEYKNVKKKYANRRIQNGRK